MLVELVVTTSERADSLYLTQWTEPLRNLCGERLDSHFVQAPRPQGATMRRSQVSVRDLRHIGLKQEMQAPY